MSNLVNWSGHLVTEGQAERSLVVNQRYQQGASDYKISLSTSIHSL